MTISERPGVYSSYEVSAALAGSGQGTVVGIAAQADSGDTGRIYTIGSYAEAVSVFGKDSNLANLVRLVLLNGATGVRAVPAGESPELGDYAGAFAALTADESVKVMLCDSRQAAVHAELRECILSASESCKYRIGVVEAAGSVQELISAAAALNCERIVLAAPAESGTEAVPGSVAAALGGLIAYGGDPALPLNGAEMFGIKSLTEKYGDGDVSNLIRGGVTPVENILGKALVVRGVTTRTTTAGAPDSTWRELTTTLVTDDVITTVRDSLKARFSRSKNTVQSRGAIRTQVIIELENKKTKEIIDGYDNVSVVPSAEDPTVCEVGFEFVVAHGLNQIHLAAHITV